MEFKSGSAFAHNPVLGHVAKSIPACYSILEMKSDTTRQAEAAQVEIFRKMTPDQRLEAAFDLTALSHKLLRAGIKHRHPEYSSAQVQLAFIRSRLPEELFVQVYPNVEDIKP